MMTPGLALTATFLSNDFPASVSSPIAFTYPSSGAKLTTQTFNLTGTINLAITNPVVSYQLFYASNSVTPPVTNVIIALARPGQDNLVGGADQSGARPTTPWWRRSRIARGGAP